MLCSAAMSPARGVKVGGIHAKAAKAKLSSAAAVSGTPLAAQCTVRAGRAAAGRQGFKVYAVDQLTGEELEVAIQSRDRPLVIDFYATWCGPCLLLANELEKVEAELSETVRIVKVDTDEEPELASQLNIQGLPTMVFVGMDASKPALRTEGLLPAETIKEIIATEL